MGLRDGLRKGLCLLGSRSYKIEAWLGEWKVP